MANKSPVSTLSVRLGNQQVGTITQLPGEQNLFVFDESYIQDSQRPTLSLSYKTAMGQLNTTTRSYRTKLPPFFSNLLPEGHLRTYLAGLGGIHPEREFYLLWLLGQDLPGAVTVTPLEGQALPPSQITPNATDYQVQDETLLRFSLAGVQLKFSALQDPLGGLTIPVGGVGGDAIAKLPSMRFPKVPENEYSMMKLAGMLGIQVPEVKLLPTSEIKNLPEGLPENFGQTLIVRRFDRTSEGKRIHFEDFAQVYGVYPEDKYQKVSYTNMAKVIWLETGEAGLVEFIRRLVFNAAIGNADMHLKNWGLIYPDGRTPILAPTYDLVSTITYIPDTKMALSLAGTKEMFSLSVDLFARLAEKAGLPQTLVVHTAQETAQKFDSIWEDSLDTLPIDTTLQKQIEQHFHSILLFRGL